MHDCTCTSCMNHCKKHALQHTTRPWCLQHHHSATHPLEGRSATPIPEARECDHYFVILCMLQQAAPTTLSTLPTTSTINHWMPDSHPLLSAACAAAQVVRSPSLPWPCCLQASRVVTQTRSATRSCAICSSCCLPPEVSSAPAQTPSAAAARNVATQQEA